MSIDLIKVDGQPGFAKDKKSGAILNINSTEIERRKEIKRRQRELAEQRDNEIAQLKNEVSEIKSLLYKLIERTND